MKKTRFLPYVLLMGLLLASAGSSSVGLAQEPPPHVEVHPQRDLSVAGTVSSQFSYQGMLEEAGRPVTGGRTMAFRLYSDDTCTTQVGKPIFVPLLPVSDGLFSIHLPVDQGDFSGQALWLEVDVEGTITGCQEIVPVPYALSLRPGATISASDDDPILHLSNAGSGNGIHVCAESHSSGASGAALWAQANGANGTAVWAAASGDDSTLVLEQDAGDGDFIRAYQTNPSNLRFSLGHNGHAYADGGWHTPASDFAEMLPAAAGLEAGDVLVIGPDGRLARSDEPCATTVVGVYSTAPGFVAGSDGDGANPGKAPLAVVGVVPVKASAEGGPIAPGDLLVSSSTPGHAKKANPHPAAGTVIGKALEGLAGDRGVIRMLVMLQ
jgi:hypothetical protein